nr:hypothetical protein [Tanacetum cinerariifolium]
RLRAPPRVPVNLNQWTGAPQGEELGLIKPLSDSSLVVPPTLSSQKAPIDKMPMLPEQHQVRPQVTSSLTCPPLPS